MRKRKLLIAILLTSIVLALVVGCGHHSAEQTSETPQVHQGQTSAEPAQDSVHITRTGAKYHREGCRYLSRSDIPIARKDAIAQGYTPCSVCNP